MSLVERLGYKSLSNLYDNMNNNEIMEWAAYDMTKDPEISDRLRKELNLENQSSQSLEQEAERMKQMFMGLSRK